MNNAIHARVAEIPSDFLKQVRTEGRDALGQQVKRVIAEGGEPCRDVLRRANKGEELILASFSPFAKPGPFHEYGPVFVLANESSEAVERDVVPAGENGNYLQQRFAIRAYSENEEIIDAALVEPADAQATVDRFFARADTAFLHVRFPSYGCFACRLDRD
ncbi:MAG TPA: DUF1203 domain-containing protein [Thermoanaerobaculia bacterium]|jgi:hypothetical protein|nr:DUF1203 domain-containing protein [Thermoanaerobaculia bacterium]